MAFDDFKITKRKRFIIFDAEIQLVFQHVVRIMDT